MKKKKLKNKILQQLYKPYKKNLSGRFKKIDELNKVIDEFTKKIFQKKDVAPKTNHKEKK